MVERGFGDHDALIGNGRRRTYKELVDWTNRLAHALVEDFGVKPGNRVLIRSGNNPAMVAAWLAVTKAGAVAVNTMPLLRAGELAAIVDKAEIASRCATTGWATSSWRSPKTAAFSARRRVRRHLEPRRRARSCRPQQAGEVRRRPNGARRRGAARVHLGHDRSAQGDRSLPPRPADHRRRLREASARLTPDDVFVGSPPLAFTFGLGGLAIFPLRFGATATLLENASPANMIEIIETYKATISFTSPTAYRAMMAAMDEGADLSSLRMAVAAGETLPAPVFEEWTQADRQADPGRHRHHRAAAHLHQQPPRRCRARARPAARSTGYEARVVDDEMNEVPDGTIGHLAVRGPTGCRYLADDRQTRLRAQRLQPDRRRFPPRRRRRLPLRGARRRHDYLLRLQHRRARGGGGAARRTRTSRNARWSARPTPSAGRSSRRMSW